MPPNFNINTSSSNDNDHQNMESSSKGSDTTTTCSTRDSFVSRTPSPCEEFNDLPTEPRRRQPQPHRRAMSDTQPSNNSGGGRRGLLMKKKSSSSLLKSFSTSRGSGLGADLGKDDNSDSSEANSETNGNGGSLPKRFSRSQSMKKGSGLFRSFSRKKGTTSTNNHSSHPARLSNVDEGNDDEIRRNSDHDTALTELVRGNSGGGLMSTADVGRMLSETADAGSSSPPPQHGSMQRGSSLLSSFSTCDDGSENELDLSLDGRDSQTMLDSLGDTPSSNALDNIAAVRAKEYIEECLSADISVLDRKKWEAIPQFCKMDLVVGQHLGKGSFSDAFEVFATIVEEETSVTIGSLNSDRDDLEKLIEAKFRGNRDTGKNMDAEIDAMFGSSHSGASTAIPEGEKEDEDDLNTNLDDEIDAMFGKKEESGDALDNEIDAMFGKKEESSGDELDNEIDDMFSYSPKPKREQTEKSKEFQPREKPLQRRVTDLSGSICMGSHQSRVISKKKRQERKVVLAMKCLRPQIRSDAEQFMIGVEDLVHETAMLASLDHPNIVKIHGRAGGGCVSNSFRLSDGFFILLDRLKDTLEERIVRWRKTMDKKAPPALSQIKTARSIADAMSYLHSKKIVFRDLKPANVGFDSKGVLKLFDFGFAIGIDEPPRSSSVCSGTDSERESHLLYDKCGTPRYMAPEVGLEMGYSLPADVYSFGILLWEICALKKPFGNVKSADEFHKTVFEKGARPKVGKHWPVALRDIITTCWDVSETDRPTMPYVKSMLAAYAREVAIQQNGGKDNLRKSSVFRRFTG